MKRKIVAIFAIFIMVSIPLGIVNAGETQEKKTIRIALSTISEEGNILTENFYTSEKELTDFQNLITNLFEKVENLENIDGILELLQRFQLRKNPLFSNALKLFNRNKICKNRAFILSSGTCYEINPLKTNEFKMRKSFSFWRYSEGSINPRTIILKPFRFNVKNLVGNQFGFMSKFTGIYIHISRTIPEKSYTFFMGTAKNAMGINFMLNPQI